MACFAAIILMTNCLLLAVDYFLKKVKVNIDLLLKTQTFVAAELGVFIKNDVINTLLLYKIVLRLLSKT